MSRLVAFAVLLAFAAGCDWIVPSDQTLCGHMCGGRGVRAFTAAERDHGGDWHASKCICDTAQPDGGR